MRVNEALYFARELRNNMTTSEKIFWEKIRQRRILELRFLRQYRIEHSNIMGVKNFFFVDFYCHELKLIVEIDGDIHISQKEYDNERETILIEMGYKIYRIKNKEVNSESRLEHFINFCKLLKQKPIIQ